MLRFEQPFQPTGVIPGAAQQFSIFLPHRYIVGLGLQTLPDGAQRQLVLPIQVIGLGKIKLRVSIAGKNPDAVLEQFDGFFFLSGGQFVDAYFQQQISIVRSKLQSLFISGRRFGGVSRPPPATCPSA